MLVMEGQRGPHFHKIPHAIFGLLSHSHHFSSSSPHHHPLSPSHEGRKQLLNFLPPSSHQGMTTKNIYLFLLFNKQNYCTICCFSLICIMGISILHIFFISILIQLSHFSPTIPNFKFFFNLPQ